MHTLRYVSTNVCVHWCTLNMLEIGFKYVTNTLQYVGIFGICICISSEKDFLRLFFNSISTYVSVLDIFFIHQHTLAKTL